MRMSVLGGTAVAQTGALAMAVHASDEDLPAGSQAGEYVIERKLGEGGMGAVYGARHPVIGKRAAVKVIKRELSASTEGVDRFVREAQAVNTIGHPNIVDVFGFGTLPDGRSFFVMEWLEGESLRDRMLRPLSFSQALEVLESIATALQAAHDAGVVHRDLKPDNVFLARQKGAPAPKVKLLDFGLAKLSGGGGDARADHTRTGVVMGTPLYLSPEQAKGAKIDTATDVYSLGVMAYEMASGRVPHNAESAVEIMAKHISVAPDPLNQLAPWIPPAFEQLVHRMMEKDARARPLTSEVAQAFTAMRAQPEIANAAAVGGAPPPQWTPGFQSSPQRTPVPAMASQLAAPSVGPATRKRGLLIAIVAGLVVAAGVAAALLVLGTSHKDEQVAAAGSGASQPVATGPAKTEPTKTQPMTTEPAGSAVTEPAGSAVTAPAGSATVATEPVKTEPVKTEPVKTEPVKTVKTEPVKPEHHAARLGTVMLQITGAPRGTVWVDGKQVAADVAQASLELAPGEHKVRVQAPGHKPFVGMVQVEAGAKKPLAVQLKKQSINTVHDPFAD
jgi:serine/threonine-protein kinase